MARYQTPIEESIGIEIYDRYVKYCTEIKAIPDPYIFFQVVLIERDRYPISRSGFTHWLMRLQMPPGHGETPYVWRDKETKAWRLRDVDVQKLMS